MGIIQNPRIDSLLRRGDVRAAVHEPLRGGDPDPDPLAALFESGPPPQGPSHAAEDASYGALTLGDFLYDYVRLDPEVMRGIDFARADDLSNVFSFAVFADRHQDLTGTSLTGWTAQLKGHVAEQIVAARLGAMGHDVTFPATSNQEGFDLLVDGTPTQVKCLSAAPGVRDHLDRFPDIPVICNRELEGSLIGEPMVEIDPTLSNSDVLARTSETLDHGADMLDFEIPWISAIVSATAAMRLLVRGDTDLTGAITNVITGTAARMMCASLGEVAVPVVGSLLFGPAGVVVGGLAGAAIGGSLGGTVARRARVVLTAGHEAELRKRCRALAEAAAAFVGPKLIAWDFKHRAIEVATANSAGNGRVLGAYIRERHADDRRYFDNRRKELERIAGHGAPAQDAVEDAMRLLLIVRRAAVRPNLISETLRSVMEALAELATQRRRFALG